MTKKSIRTILGENVKHYRLLNKFTQEKLAELCNLSTRYISDIENANGNISIDTLEKIANIFEIEYYVLIKENTFNK